MSARMIVDDVHIENISQLLLFQDHHAWRAMLAAGVPEELIRGNGEDWEKFLAYARVLPQAIGNPLYHLTHMTLRELFGIEEPLNESTARAIWSEANQRLTSPEYRVQGLARWRCTACAPTRTAERPQAYQQAQARGLKLRLKPIFCPDVLLSPGQAGFVDYVRRLGDSCGIAIRSVADLITAIDKRMDYFHAYGCRAADHSMDALPRFTPDEEKANRALRAALSGAPIKGKALASYQSLMYLRLGHLYARRGWVQHYHLSALRNTNQRMYVLYGGDTGFDAISDEPVAQKLSRLLDAQDRSMSLPKTVLYSANPAQNAALMALLGSHQQSDLPGKMQMGAPWRFQNNRRGIEKPEGPGQHDAAPAAHRDDGGRRVHQQLLRHSYFRRFCATSWADWWRPANTRRPPLLKATVRAIAYRERGRLF